MIKIDILCPLYNFSNDYEKFIHGIRKQKEVIINKFILPVTESNDNTLELANSIENSIIIPIKKKDFSHSLTREMAINYAESDVVIFLSQDVIMDNEYALFNLASSIKDDIIHAFSRQISKSKGIEKYTREKNYPDYSYVVSKEDIEKMQIKAFFSSDACSAYNREKFIHLGGFDNKKIEVSEDMYYCRKALLAGYKIKYCSESIVIHSHDLTLKQLYKRYYDIGKFFAQNPEFKKYKSVDSGLSLAWYIFKKLIQNFDVKNLLRFFPDMVVRILGKKKGEKSERIN